MSIKMTNYEGTIILAFSGFAVPSAFILDHYFNGGRAFDYLKEKFKGFKRWFAGDPNGAGVQANPSGGGVQANPNDADIQANPNGAGIQAYPNGAVVQTNQDDVVSELNSKGSCISRF